MSENIEAARLWHEKSLREYRFTEESKRKRDGLDELFAFYDERTAHDESPVGKAEAALHEAAADQVSCVCGHSDCPHGTISKALRSAVVMYRSALAAEKTE